VSVCTDRPATTLMSYPHRDAVARKRQFGKCAVRNSMAASVDDEGARLRGHRLWLFARSLSVSPQRRRPHRQSPHLGKLGLWLIGRELRQGMCCGAICVSCPSWCASDRSHTRPCDKVRLNAKSVINKLTQLVDRAAEVGQSSVVHVYLRVTVVVDEQFLRQVHPNDRRNFMAHIRGLSSDNPSHTLTFRFIRPDGRQVWRRRRRGANLTGFIMKSGHNRAVPNVPSSAWSWATAQTLTSVSFNDTHRV
jgi:hypothetical protein